MRVQTLVDDSKCSSLLGCVQARYADSIESLVRNNIQKIKTDMANEVIDAGRFDMATTMAERKNTLESMLQACALPLQSAMIWAASSCCPSQTKLCNKGLQTRCCARPGLDWNPHKEVVHFSLANGTGPGPL